VPLRRETRSDEARAYRRWYGLAVWAKARNRQLRIKPLCERCEPKGHLVPATIVNHRKPHKGDWALFIDPENHQSLCSDCHDGPVQAEERSGRPNGRTGYRTTVNADGNPTDPRHPFYGG
jgi:5-methylcytosine-specific restriction endonuclease McrA